MTLTESTSKDTSKVMDYPKNSLEDIDLAVTATAAAEATEDLTKGIEDGTAESFSNGEEDEDPCCGPCLLAFVILCIQFVAWWISYLPPQIGCRLVRIRPEGDETLLDVGEQLTGPFNFFDDTIRNESNEFCHSYSSNQEELLFDGYVRASQAITYMTLGMGFVTTVVLFLSLWDFVCCPYNPFCKIDPKWWKTWVRVATGMLYTCSMSSGLILLLLLGSNMCDTQVKLHGSEHFGEENLNITVYDDVLASCSLGPDAKFVLTGSGLYLLAALMMMAPMPRHAKQILRARTAQKAARQRYITEAYAQEDLVFDQGEELFHKTLEDRLEDDPRIQDLWLTRFEFAKIMFALAQEGQEQQEGTHQEVHEHLAEALRTHVLHSRE